MNYGFAIDNGACIGCHACSTACKSENQVPVGVHRTWVKVVEAGHYPDVRRHFQVTRCNHCQEPPCVHICPVTAMFQREDGIVEFDGDACIGCKGCMQACPYDAIYLDPDTHTAAKCHYCAHRVEVGMEPACVVVCPEHAIIAGDLDDPESEISRVLKGQDVQVRKPELGTQPNVFYIEGERLNLDPAAATMGQHMMWSDVQEPGPIQLADGTMAEQMVQVAFNAQHQHLWHWPIPLYMVTKHLAAGVFFWLSLSVLGGGEPLALASFDEGFLPAGALALLMLGLTLGLLLYDLDRPDRFFLLLLRPQWRSWIARAAWILTAFSALAGGWWATELLLANSLTTQTLHLVRMGFAALTLPLAVMASIYTVFLFRQAKGREAWQMPHLIPQMAVHGLLFGALGLAAVGSLALAGLVPLLLAASLVLTLGGDLFWKTESSTAQKARKLMLWGTYQNSYWLGGILLGHLLPLLLIALGGPWWVVLLMVGVGQFLGNLALVMAPQDVANS